MSRTRRRYQSAQNHREARGGRAKRDAEWAKLDAMPPGAYELHPAERLTPEWAPHTNGGGMLMSSSNSGMWWDETHDDTVKRAIKRGERQRVKREIQEEL